MNLIITTSSFQILFHPLRELFSITNTLIHSCYYILFGLINNIYIYINCILNCVLKSFYLHSIYTLISMSLSTNCYEHQGISL